MATNAQQIAKSASQGRLLDRAGWWIGLGLVVLVGLAVGLMLLISTPTVQTSGQKQSPVMNASFGIDMPVGVLLEQLPTGLRDYVRNTFPGMSTTSTHNTFGIDTPANVYVAALPAGLTDYLHDHRGIRTIAYKAAALPALNPKLGIDMPAGATYADLPAGLTDYVR